MMLCLYVSKIVEEYCTISSMNHVSLLVLIGIVKSSVLVLINIFLPVTNGQFSVDYIFPDDGEHRIILHLYENMTHFTVSSFDLSIPHPTPPSQTDKLLKPFMDFFDSIF
jgi:hypothetical protein